MRAPVDGAGPDGVPVDDYMTADDWGALVRLNERSKRGLAAAAVSASQSEKLVRRGYLEPAATGTGYVVSSAGRLAIANWERSRRT